MEQPVWFYVGIIAAIIALLGIFQLLALNNDNLREQAGKNSITKIERMCNLVCNSQPDTLLDAEVDFGSGSKIYANNNVVCVEYKTKDCIQCDCPVEMQELDLTSEEAMQLFVTHKYNCYFKKLDSGSVEVECRG
ncbi:MAG: hypothetical protein JW772_04845 [Candidatus Diapherotrites archaeon]|nr:hypothetical protein [Candidatus Diapherotrites archaeon]